MQKQTHLFKRDLGSYPLTEVTGAETIHSGSPLTLLKVILTCNTYIMLLNMLTNM